MGLGPSASLGDSSKTTMGSEKETLTSSSLWKALARRRRRTNQKAQIPPEANTATPPTVPPAMAPTFLTPDEFDVAASDSDSDFFPGSDSEPLTTLVFCERPLTGRATSESISPG